MILYADLETYSTIDIKAGTHRYAEAAEILLFPYAIDDGEVQCWDVASGDPMPEELAAQLRDPNVMTVWHNGGMFDLIVLNSVRPAGLGLPHDRVFDTMVAAYAHSLPGSLDALCSVLGVDADKAKLKTGKQLIQLFCKTHNSSAKKQGNALEKTPDGRYRATRETHPEQWQQFIEYAKADILSMREVYKKIPKWNYKWREGFEYDLWLLDQKINNRGVLVDVALAHAAIEEANKAQKLLAERTEDLTEGAVESATKRDALLYHIFEQYGIPMDDLQADTIERRMADPDIPEPLKELLGVRLQATTTSVRKYDSLARGVSTDNRLRGLLQFDGATRTGRWSGRLFQPQNLPRPTMDHEDIDIAIDAIKAGAVSLMYDDDDVMGTLSNCIRGALIAPEGRHLVVADLSNIEGRSAVYLAREEWKLQYFRDFDAGRITFDNYVMAYSKAFHVPPEDVTKANRQVGKVMELMLQYGGGVGAFATGAATYRIDLEDLSNVALPTIPKDVADQAREFLSWTRGRKMHTYGMSDEAFITCDALKRLWRNAHPMVSSFWNELESNFKSAIENPGKTFETRGLKMRRDGAWTRIRLPSGRFLCYPGARLEDDGAITYMGQNQYTRRWCRLKTYSGKIFENITQAFARDVMAHAMPLAEADDFDIVLTVHDELITEAPLTHNAARLCGHLSAVPIWAQGLPLAAAGFESTRYRKD